MTRRKDLLTWRGPRDDEVLDPEQLQFTTRQSKRGCKGCIFERQWGAVCKKAGEVAQRAGLEDCDTGHVYVPTQKDGRQLDILENADAAAQHPAKP